MLHYISQTHIKYIKNLVSITAGGDLCCLTMRSDDPTTMVSTGYSPLMELFSLNGTISYASYRHILETFFNITLWSSRVIKFISSSSIVVVVLLLKYSLYVTVLLS